MGKESSKDPKRNVWQFIPKSNECTENKEVFRTRPELKMHKELREEVFCTILIICSIIIGYCIGIYIEDISMFIESLSITILRKFKEFIKKPLSLPDKASIIIPR